MPTKRQQLARRIKALETRAADPTRDAGYQRQAKKVWKAIDKYLRRKGYKEVVTKEHTGWGYTQEGSPVVVVEPSFFGVQLPKGYQFTLIVARRKDAPKNIAGRFRIEQRWITIWCLPNDFDFGLDRPDTRYSDVSDMYTVRELPVDIRPCKGTFIHEFIHYMDYKDRIKKTKRGRQVYDIERGTEKDWSLYFNDPVEFNAFFQQGAHEIYQRHRRALDTFARRMRDLRNPSKLAKVMKKVANNPMFKPLLEHAGAYEPGELLEVLYQKHRTFGYYMIKNFVEYYVAGPRRDHTAVPNLHLRTGFLFFLSYARNHPKFFQQNFVKYLNKKYMRKFEKRLYQLWKKMIGEADRTYIKWLPYSYTQLYLR